MNNFEKGSLLLLAVLVLGVLMLLGIYFLTFSLTEFRISESQKVATQTYYLAEAGINEAIWKLKNDPIWSSNFITTPTCEDWEANFERDPALFPNGSYEVSIKNTSCGNGVITATSTIDSSQRRIEIKVFKAQDNPVSDFNLFTGGPSENMEIRFTDPLNIYDGDVFGNNNINLKQSSKVNLDGDRKAMAHNNLVVSANSDLNATSCAKNICDSSCEVDECPPDKIGMPQIDFDSSTLSSYLERAKSSDCSFIRTDGKTNCVFTPAEFEDLMWDNYPVLSLPANITTYVTGDINIRAAQELTVNGVLAADRDINIGDDNCWNHSDPPFSRCGFCRLEVYRPGAPGDDKPSGILAKRKVNFGKFAGFGALAVYIEGLIYAGAELDFSRVQALIEIHGGIAARKLEFSSMWNGIDLYLDSDVIIDTFSEAFYSPVITVDHWEEEY
ncbi:hypothetical protein KAR26_01975 [Candidatus Parcubacteria bacterium]|nr:hypothetical protein [Candidatus Parcubacteria bacterium]